ncbi:filamin A-interacting protein 1-like [Brienomyrus brachyistius]|uniref:filamin A-interacting protein 1-like n=1 Tax=Brienomyrus brachyistius TaxID=42636 RepID=UPI0020B3FF83|nr:filamin A-interacting protein 1-like [Brienomyrus brachyistius]
MRSRSNSLEKAAKTKLSHHRARSRRRSSECDDPPSRGAGRARRREHPDDTGTVLRNHKGGDSGKSERKAGASSGKGRDLSRDDLLFLLSILEGELQARDEVITVLKAEKIDLALLEAHYGFVTPHKVLQALQRDALQGKGNDWQEDIYEKPMAELDKLVEKPRETHRRTLEQLLLVEQAHKQALCKLEDEKRNHSDFVQKSDEFTNLLEQDRERLKLLIDQEKVYQERKEEENNRKISRLKQELTKLKSFTLLVVDEQQRLTEQLTQQSAKVQELAANTAQAQEDLNSAQARAQEEEHKVCQLQAELRDQACRFHQEQEAMTAKLTNEDAQNRQLRQKLASLSRQLDELEETNKTLRRAEEELQDLRDKISRGECGNSSLMSEVEELRKRVLEMEGKDEELIKMEDQCRDLNKKLEKESSQGRNLKLEVDKLNRRIMELEKLEDAFSKSKQECCSLKCNLEKERTVTKYLSNELDSLKVRIKELEAIEGQLGKTEITLKEDLTKLKTLTVMLVDERKTMAEKLKQMEDKLQNSTGKLQAEQDKVTSVTEKLIEESKKALKSKAELEEKMCITIKDRDELRAKLKTEEEQNYDLQSKISMMKKRLQSLEAVEREFLRNKAKEEQTKVPVVNRFHQEDNKVKDLTQEVERLRRKLKEMKVVEGDSMKTEDELESLENRYSNEHERAKALLEELEISRKELSKYQLAEKAESSQEHTLYKRLKEEEAKSSHLTREVEALKEKVHEYMGTEDSVCRMKSEHAFLQKKLTQQEVRNKELAREMENLTKELERYRRFSKSLRPGMNGRRFSDLQVSTKEVQTDPTESKPPAYKSVAPLERALMNGKLYEENNHEDEPNYNIELPLTKCNPSLTSNVNNLTNNNFRRVSFPRSKESQQQVNGKVLPRPNGNYMQQGDVVLTHSPGQPLHIKVTPDHGQNTAMLEITSPTTESTHSYTSTAVIPTSGGPPKQRITIIQNACISPPSKAKGSTVTDRPGTPDRAISPLTMATYTRTTTPDSSGSLTPDRAISPIQIVSVTTATPERSMSAEAVEVLGGHAVFRVTPERQNSWQLQRSNSSGPSVITTEDNKIHIHLGSPYIQAINSTSRPMSPGYTNSQEHRTPVLTNGVPAKGGNKITSSITITPTASPIPRPSQITVPLEAFRYPGPTRIPKPKSQGAFRGRSTASQSGQSKGQPPAQAAKDSAHIRRSYLDVLNSRMGSTACGSRNPAPRSLPSRAKADVKASSATRPEDLQAEQVSISQQQLVHLIRSLIFQQKETAIASVGSDLKVLQEDLHLKKTNIYRSIPYSRLGSNRDAHCYRKAYPHLLAFKRSCQEGGRLLVQAQRWSAVLEYALVAWRYVSALPQWDTSGHNALREQCYGVLADLCASALHHQRPGLSQAQELLRRFKIARTQCHLISPCLEELEKIVDKTRSSTADVALPNGGPS